MLGIVQFNNYLRAIQFVIHVSLLNDRLKVLDDKVIKIKVQSEGRDGRKFNFDCLSTSTELYESIELHRETFTRIWKLQTSLNECFGLSVLVITMNALFAATFTLYFNIITNSRNITPTFVTQPAIHVFHLAILFIVMVNSCEDSGVLVNYGLI